ncbi:hypothetical protein LSAT2_015643, partial [Lamellibrachia satsuma]
MSFVSDPTAGDVGLIYRVNGARASGAKELIGPPVGRVEHDTCLVDHRGFLLPSMKQVEYKGNAMKMLYNEGRA